MSDIMKFNIRKFFKANKCKKRMVQCKTVVDKSAIKRVNIDGVEHIVITSKTLPDDIVMNGGLYPASEIESSFMSLERTLAPIEHPTDSQGNFISASDPVAIHNFHAGAHNQNVRRENGRVLVDKVINVQEAMKSDRGKRLLDRIEELESNSDPRPIHTSVGVWLEVEELSEIKSNAMGQDYEWIARNMVFDHDAILLSSVGAAQPHQGVGMAVNEAGDEIEVHESLVTIDADDRGVMSHSEIREALDSAIKQPPLDGDWVTDVVGDKVIFWSDEQLFSATFSFEGRKARIVDVPMPVDRDVTYIPKTNQKGDAMRELMLRALSKAGISVNADISDEELLAKYNALNANQESDGGDDGEGDDKAKDLADVVANALKPLTEKLAGLEAKLNSADQKELDRLAAIVGNSDKYPGIDAETAEKLGVETLSKMAANCAPAFGIPLTTINAGSDDDQAFDMPA